MAEIVQFKIEGMLPELEDLEKKKIFNKTEIKAIVKKRTNFEYSVRRRGPTREDFLRYIEYEMNLDALRKKRKSRLGIQSKKTTISDFSITNRIKVIFERALHRHKGDIGLWLQYIDFAKKSGLTRLQSELYARAIQVHPRNTTLWLAAASFEFDENANMAGARTLLQRSLRLNPKEQSLWHTYFRLELIYIEKIKARRRLLSIGGQAGDGPEEKKESADVIRLVPLEDELKNDSENNPRGIRDISEKTRTLMASDNNPFLKGAVTAIIYQKAIEEIPDDLDFRLKFAQMYAETGDADLEEAKQNVFKNIKQDFAKSEGARAFMASSNMKIADPNTPEFVDELERTVTAFHESISELKTSTMYFLFLEFLVKWVRVTTEPNLRLYLSETAKAVFTSAKGEGQLDSSIYKLWLPFVRKQEGDTEYTSSLAIAATEAFPNSPDLWIARINIEMGNAKKGSKAGKRLDSLILDSALSSNAGSYALWYKWLSWIEWQWKNQRISTHEAQKRYISAVTRCGTLTSEYHQTRDMILTRFLDWAARIPRSQLDDGELSRIEDFVGSDDDEEDYEGISEKELKKRFLKRSKNKKLGTNIDSVRAMAKKAQLQTFPTTAFFERCIEYESIHISQLENTHGSSAKRTQDYRDACKHIVMLFESAVRVDNNDSAVWIKYAEFLQKSGQDHKLGDLHWKASAAFTSQDQKSKFDVLANTLIQSFQEIDINNERSGSNQQAKIIAEQLGLNGGFVTEFVEIKDPCRSAIQQGGGVHGNAIYSKFDMEFRVVDHKHQPYDWNNHGRFLCEPREGKRYTIAANISIPNREPILAYSAHFECFCGISGRVGQLADLIQDSRTHADKFPHQLIFGDFNTFGHSLARFSPIFCTDRYRWGSLGMSEPEWWHHHILSWYSNDGPKNLLLQHQPLPRGVDTTDEWLLKNTVNPDWWDPYDVRKDITISNHLGWMKAKVDWSFVRRMKVVSNYMDNEDFQMSDHKCLVLEVDYSTPEQDQKYRELNKLVARDLESRRQSENFHRKAVFAAGGLACAATIFFFKWVRLP
ncbi:U3 snoRNP protein [Mycoemilia scoparia]|uniref:U3 snoRNP protein n=1 Tax=Mycoemilia scoparia TaxID=417184 RepID=A0A9W7ZV22_9FUNG|nr:U3 snoRNP protein [Mycoemilia scoparia]